ncbi:maltose/moltooligosaccharide transporter [Hephaestia caeni]|uniref:Maltose/moltooligosaccharide transporter n=1 Tax=Hephaestia caeni TaxID=645617 RepID=A0A397P9V5_9SPHN|nr:MFS transporter [Hephaestia caeni]RIA45708.1 maltose/moltooligosaccharide transporter [Hephaestia caeni]
MTKTKPLLGFWGLWNISFGFFGIQVGFALQGANVSRIFQTLGAPVDDLAILWIAGPVTGLLVQPLIGHYSDRTWGRLGRRRPYFLAGAILSTLALVAMPNAGVLWIAAGLLWVLDASINVSMEPFRAFVGDMLDERQRTRGYAFQTIFIGAGAVLASTAPWFLTRVVGLSNVAAPGEIPITVRYAFYLGAAMLLFTVLWTVLTSREYSPDEMAAFDNTPRQTVPHASAAPSVRQGAIWAVTGAVIVAGVALLGLDKPLYILGFGLLAFGSAQIVNRWRLAANADRLLNHILSDLNAMPPTMRRLAVIQFLSWFAMFILFIYATPVVAAYQFGATDPATQAYNDGADWVGLLFGVYNGVAALWAFAIPAIAARIGALRLHAINLVAGGLGFASVALIRDPHLLLLSMVGVGMAWSSILTVPYSILCGSLPSTKLGVYMGLFNIFIVLPQLVVSTVMGSLARHLYPHAQGTAFLIAGAFMAAAAVASLRLERDPVARAAA